MDTLTGLVEFLVQNGPWAIVVIQGVVVFRLAVYIERMHTRHHDTVTKLLLDHNRNQKDETKQLVGVMTLTESSLKAMNDTLDSLSRRL